MKYKEILEGFYTDPDSKRAHADLMNMTHEVLSHHGFDYRNQEGSRNVADYLQHQHWGKDDDSRIVDHPAVKADLEGLGWKPYRGTTDHGHYTFERWDHPGPLRTYKQLKLSASKERGTARVEFG